MKKCIQTSVFSVLTSAALATPGYKCVVRDFKPDASLGAQGEVTIKKGAYKQFAVGDMTGSTWINAGDIFAIHLRKVENGENHEAETAVKGQSPRVFTQLIVGDLRRAHAECTPADVE